MLPFDAHHALAFFSDTWKCDDLEILKAYSEQESGLEFYHSTVSAIYVHLVTQHDERKVFRVWRTGLYA